MRDYSYKRHEAKGPFKILVKNDLTVDILGIESESDIAYVHGWLMWAAWGLLGLFQILTNRYLKLYWKVNKIFHVIFGFGVLILTFVMGLLMIKQMRWEIEK